MRLSLQIYILVGASLSFVIGQAPAQSPNVSQEEVHEERRARILHLAEQYANLKWQASGKNILHGTDPDGILVDTPDTQFDEKGWKPDGKENVGMPYAWGGFTSLEDFQRMVNLGMFAGHVPKTERARASRFAVGVDCSGLVSRCWELPLKQSTRSLGSLSYALDSYEDLLPGDILNSFDGHVVIFKDWANENREELRTYEAARLRVKETIYKASTLMSRGFVPLRYRPLDARWISMDACISKSMQKSEEQELGRWIPDKRQEKNLSLEELQSPAQDTIPLEWVRYRISDTRLDLSTSVQARMVARMNAGKIDVQTLSLIRGKELMSGMELLSGASVVDALIEFLAFPEPLKEFSVVQSQVEQGRYVFAGRHYPAFKVRTILTGQAEIRNTRYPVQIRMDYVQSGKVPIHGIFEAEATLELTWGKDKEGKPMVSRTKTRFQLEAMGKP